MNITETNLKEVQPSSIVYNAVVMPTSLPFEVEQDLQKYSKLFVCKLHDPFRVVDCFDSLRRDFIIYAEGGDGDKKILFTVSNHFECCNCCEQCIIGLSCCHYACCNSIVFQLDYRREGHPFYTQGNYITKGCHCCEGGCDCSCADCRYVLFLRENVTPEDPNYNVGRKKGRTETNCCICCQDKYATYHNENNIKGPTVKVDCCEGCKNTCMNYFCFGTCINGFDFEMNIENENGDITGKIYTYAGCCSDKTQGRCCFLPRPYYEVNLPPQASSVQKFQIIADLIHLDLMNRFIGL